MCSALRSEEGARRADEDAGGARQMSPVQALNIARKTRTLTQPLSRGERGLGIGKLSWYAVPPSCSPNHSPYARKDAVTSY